MSIANIIASTKPFIVGADEVGYGALAGPLVVCGVKAPKEWNLEGLNDSKKLSEKKRAAMRIKLIELVDKGEIVYCQAERTNSEIDREGMARAIKSCYVEIFSKLNGPDTLLIADGLFNFAKVMGSGYDGIALPKADSLVPTVMAASILAKTYRDEKMKIYHHQYPQYGWNTNVGYPAKAHKNALHFHGPTPLHRYSYAPVAKAAAPSASLAREIDKEILDEMFKLADELEKDSK